MKIYEDFSENERSKIYKNDYFKYTKIIVDQYFKDKLSLFYTEVSFDTSEENQLSYFQNDYFFKILW